MDGQQNNGDLLNIVSILLALQNLHENREQTKQNDVQAANDKQAKVLIKEMNLNFAVQYDMIKNISKKLFDIEEKIDKILEDNKNGKDTRI